MNNHKRRSIKSCRAVTDINPGAFSLSQKESCPLPCLDPSRLLWDTTTELLQTAQEKEKREKRKENTHVQPVQMCITYRIARFCGLTNPSEKRKYQ